MVVELMNDGSHKIKLVYEKGRLGQLQVEKDEDGFEEDIFFSISATEARQIIKGLTEYIGE